MDKILVNRLLIKLEQVENEKPDDQWDTQCFKGFKAGIIESISIVTGQELNYNLTATEIRAWLFR